MSFNTARVDTTLEFNEAEYDFEALCGATPALEDTLVELEDALFWDEVSDYIEEHKDDNQPANDEGATNIFAAAGFKLSRLRQQS